MDEKITRLQKILDESRYTVALCGSGMMEEAGFIGIKNQDKAYDIEEKYGYCSEELYTSAFYNTRPELFLHFTATSCSTTPLNPPPQALPWRLWNRTATSTASSQATSMTSPAEAAART